MKSNLMTLPQLHRSGRTSLVRLQIRNYQLVVLSRHVLCLFAMTASAILADLPILSRIQHAFMNLSTYRWFYRFFGFSLLSLSQLHRSNQTSLLMIIDQTQNCFQIHLYQTVNLFACYTLFIKLIGSTLLYRSCSIQPMMPFNVP